VIIPFVYLLLGAMMSGVELGAGLKLLLRDTCCDGWLTGQSLSRAQNISSGVNKLRAREKIGPVNQPLTSQSTCLINRFAPFFGEVTIGWLTEGLAQLNFELWIGDATEIARKRERKQKTDRQDAQHNSAVAEMENRFPKIWGPSGGIGICGNCYDIGTGWCRRTRAS
jgi:hypothetical protein